MMRRYLRPESRLFLSEPRQFVLPSSTLTTRQRVNLMQYHRVLGGPDAEGYLRALKDHGRWLLRKLKGRWFRNRAGL